MRAAKKIFLTAIIAPLVTIFLTILLCSSFTVRYPMKDNSLGFIALGLTAYFIAILVMETSLIVTDLMDTKKPITVFSGEDKIRWVGFAWILVVFASCGNDLHPLLYLVPACMGYFFLRPRFWPSILDRAPTIKKVSLPLKVSPPQIHPTTVK